MGTEEIRKRLDGLVAAGAVPPEERESVRAQVDELAATDPTGADHYRSEFARLDPRLFPPSNATALSRLLRAVRPLRPVTRESAEDQGLMVTSSLFAYAVLTPAVRGLLTGEFPWLTPGQLAMTAAVTAVASVPAIYYLMPYGKSAQNQEDPEQNRIGRRTVIEAETLHTIFFMHFFGRIFGWDPLVTVWNATWQGLTKGFPLSQIYRRWGDERQGLWMRQGAMILMMTDQAVASSVASAGSSDFSLAQMGWVAAFNLLLGKALALIPERGRTLRTDLETLWEETREARARYQVPSHTEVLQDGSPTMLICERLIEARMKETGLERKNITVVVAGHDGVSAEVGVWLKLGVTVVAVEVDVCNRALKTSLEEQGIDVGRLILKPIESRDIPQADIALWNFPGMTDRYIWEYPAVMGNPLKPGGILVVQTENRWLELQLEFSRRWKTLLVDSRITPSNHLLPSQYMPTIFGRASLLILKDRSTLPDAAPPQTEPESPPTEAQAAAQDPAARITQIRERIGELLEIRRALMGSYYPWYRDPRYEALKGLPSEKTLVDLAREIVRLELDWPTPPPVGTAVLGPWDRFNQAERALVAEPLNKEAAVKFVIARERYFLTTSPVPDNLADAGSSLPLDRHSKVVVQIPVYCELDNGHFFRLLRDFSRQTTGPETFELTFMVSEHASELGSDRNWPENEKTISLIRYLAGEVPQQPDWVAELAGWQRAILDSVKSGGFTIRLILTPGIERNIGKIRDEAAREAIRRARGEGRDVVIALMDADTQVSPDYVEKIRHHFEGGDCDALFMNLAFHSDEGGRDEFFYRTGYQSRYALTWTDVLSGSLFPNREMGVEVGAYQIAVRASVLERLGGIPHDAVNEDFHLARRISRRARWRFAPDLEVVTADREREVGFDDADRVADLGLLRQGEGLDQIHEPRHHYYIETLLPILSNMIRGSEADEGRWSRLVTLFGIPADWNLWTELRSQTAERVGGTDTDHSQFTVFTLYSYLVSVGNHKSLFPDDLLLSALGHFLSGWEAERLQERLRETEGAHELTRQRLRRIMAIAVSNLNAGHELLQGINDPDVHEFLRVNPWISGYLERNRAHFSDGEVALAFLEEQFSDWLKPFDETPIKKHTERMRVLARFFQEARNSPDRFSQIHQFLRLIAGEVSVEEGRNAIEVGTLQRRAAGKMAVHPEVFAPNQCHFTVRNFLLRHIPREQLSHVRVLCIRKKGGGDVIGGRGALKPSETLGDFQTTIEIGGRIYGYWYRGRPGTSIDTYVSEMFPKEDLDDLTVLSIPAQEYVDYPVAAEALPYFWQRDDLKVVPLRDYVHAAMARYGHQNDFEDIENRLETYERFTATVEIQTSGDGITIRYNGGSGFTPAIFSEKFKAAVDTTKEPFSQARHVQLTVFVSSDAVVEAEDIQQVAARELEEAGYSGPVNLRLFRGPQASTRLFSIEPDTTQLDPATGTGGVPSPMLLAGGNFLTGGGWLAAPGLADHDLSWVPRSGAVLGALAFIIAGLVAAGRYATYRRHRAQIDRHLENWPEVKAVMLDALKAFRGNEMLPDWQVNIWRRKPNIVEHRFRIALAVSGMLRSVMAASETDLSSETEAESGVAVREWAQSLTDLMNDLRGSFPPEVWRIYGTAALEKLGRAIGSLQTMINEQLCRIAEEEDSRVRRLALVGKATHAAGERIKLGRSILQLLNRSVEEFEWEMLRDSLQILVVDGNPGQMPVRSIDSARGRGASGGVPDGTQWSRQVEKVAELLLGLIQLLHRHPERTIPLEKIFKVLACRDSELAEEGAQVERLKRIMRGLKSHMEALTLVHEVAAREPTHDENVSWKRIGEIVEKGDIPRHPFKIDRVTFQSRDRDLEKFRLETPQVQLVIENVEKLEIEKRAAFLQKFAGKPVVILFDPKQKIDASRLESAKGWVKVVVGERLGIDPRRIEVVPTFYTAGLVDLAAARREGRTPAPVSVGKTSPPVVTGTVPRPALRVVPRAAPSRLDNDPKPGGGGGGGPMTALAMPVELPDLSWRGRDDRSNPPIELVRSPRRPASGGTPRDDVLGRQLILLAQSRGLNETAALIARLTEEQIRKLAGQSHLWRDILTKRGMGDVADHFPQAAPLSATNRVLLLLAAASGSQKDVESLGGRIVGWRKASQAAPGFSPSRFSGPVTFPGVNPGTLLLTK